MLLKGKQQPAVIVDPYSSGAFFAPAFSLANVPVIAVVSAPKPPDIYSYSYRPDDFQRIIVATDNLSPVIKLLNALQPRCVLAGCESGVELADKIAPHIVPSVANCAAKASARRDKGAMAAALHQAGLPIIRQICTDDAKAVAKWLEDKKLYGQDLVIKPPKSASTDGVTRIPNGKNWRAVFTNLLGQSNRLGLCNDRLVVQEYVTGIEYVVDTMSYEGKHSICDICQYHKVDNGNYMAIYDSMLWLPTTIPTYDILVNYTRNVLDAVGMRFGTAHVEIMLTDKGPRLIEIGARPHGGGHPQFCCLATGDSQVDRAVRYFVDQAATIPDSFTLKQHVMVVFLICRKSGYVRNSEVLKQVKQFASYHYANVNVENGDWVEPTKDLFASLNLGFVVLAHKDKQQVLQDYQNVRKVEQTIQLSIVKE